MKQSHTHASHTSNTPDSVSHQYLQQMQQSKPLNHHILVICFYFSFPVFLNPVLAWPSLVHNFLTHSFHFIEHVTDELISENRRFKYLRHPNCAVIRKYWSICVQPCSWRASSNTYFEWYNLNIKIQWGSSDLILGSLSLSS